MFMSFAHSLFRWEIASDHRQNSESCSEDKEELASQGSFTLKLAFLAQERTSINGEKSHEANNPEDTHKYNKRPESEIPFLFRGNFVENKKRVPEGSEFQERVPRPSRREKNPSFFNGERKKKPASPDLRSRFRAKWRRGKRERFSIKEKLFWWKFEHVPSPRLAVPT